MILTIKLLKTHQRGESSWTPRWNVNVEFDNEMEAIGFRNALVSPIEAAGDEIGTDPMPDPCLKENAPE